MLRKKYPNSSDFMDEKMDFITSNYPFSVKSFTKDLNPSDVELFDLCKYTTDKSQQIENLFLEDTIQKLKGHSRQQGEKNSQYGTCWVTHPIFGNKKIGKQELDNYIQLGYNSGRKFYKGSVC